MHRKRDRLERKTIGGRGEDGQGEAREMQEVCEGTAGEREHTDQVYTQFS